MRPVRRDGRRGPVDWGAIRARLAAAIEATEVAGHASPGRAREVLEERARALARARPGEDGRGRAPSVEVVTFALGGERWAIEARRVREVARLADLAPVPGVPDFILGVTHLRGEILAVVDLRRLLGLAAAGLTDLSRVLVLGDDGPEIGVLADAVDEVLALALDAILPPPASLSGPGRECLRGVTKEALIVLDAARLLADPRLFVGQGKEAP